MTVQYSLFKAFAVGMADYILRHIENATAIENALNELWTLASGSITGLAVPTGLREIFDRLGLIGAGSYDFDEGELAGPPNYYLSVAPGAFWGNGVFASKALATDLGMLGKDTGTYYLNIDAAGNPAVSASVAAGTVRQFAWDAATHIVSAKALYAGVAILFDGDDYADCLDSAARSKSFTKLADRLEEIEAMVSEMGMYYAQDHLDGLDFYYQAGKVRNDSVIYDTAAGHVTAADDAANYVEVDPADGTVSINQVGFTSGLIPLFGLITASGEITSVTDVRTWATTGGVAGGGHTQGTDLGTTASQFEIDTDASGSPTGRAGLRVNNGDDPAAALKFNRDTGKWEYSEDETTWRELNDPVLDLGVQELSKYVPFEDPPLVLEDLARGSSADYEILDLTSFLPVMLGAVAVVIRVQFADDAPAYGVNALFKKYGSLSSPALANTVWSGLSDPATLIVPLAQTTFEPSDLYRLAYWINASGADTANLKVWLLGYFEKVVGVGTQDRSFSETGLNVGAGATVDFDLTGFLNRGLCHYLKVEETGGVLTGTYDLHLYAKDTFLAADLLYKAEGIDPAADFEDWLPFWVRDLDASNELHLRIINNDGVNAGVFTITLNCEQFA